MAEKQSSFWQAVPLDRKTRKDGGWIKLAKDEQEEYVPEPLHYSKKQTGVAFHKVHDTEKVGLIKKIKCICNAKIMHKPSDQTDILICEDSDLNCLVLLAILRGAAIVRPSYVYESDHKSKLIPMEPFEVNYFPKVKERSACMKTALKDLRFSIDNFPGSSVHKFLSDPMLEYLIAEMGGTLVKKNSYGDFIISAKNEKYAVSSIFKKVDYSWLIESLLKNKLQPVENYYF